MVKSTPRARARLRKLCLALAEAQEVEAWGEPTFRVRKKMFAIYANAGNHHGGVWKFSRLPHRRACGRKPQAGGRSAGSGR